ncbi:MAG: HNH endonuclease, partial [Actinobacteria bacterium]|nr:HNH endonuclease [Actinomycetota bacterium]
FINRLDAETDRLWLKAHRQGNLLDQAEHDQNGTDLGASADAAGACDRGGRKSDVRRSALAAHAFVRMMESGGKGKTNRADMVIVCDLEAYRRGHAHDGEPCHIIGGGPIPVSLAKELGRDAFLKAVLHTGTEIHTIAHFGRRYPAVLQTALDIGPAPTFNGAVCTAPGCSRRYHLQRDHIDPVANGGETSYANNQPLCPPDHRMKTERDRKAGLLGRKPFGPPGGAGRKRRQLPRPAATSPANGSTSRDPFSSQAVPSPKPR